MISLYSIANIVLVIIIVLILYYYFNTTEYFTSDKKDATYKTKSGKTFTKSKIKTCDIVTSPITFPVGTSEKEALEICANEKMLGGHGQCIGILPFNKQLNPNANGDTDKYPWIGCLSTAFYSDCPGDTIKNGGTWLNLEEENVNSYQFG